MFRNSLTFKLIFERIRNVIVKATSRQLLAQRPKLVEVIKYPLFSRDLNRKEKRRSGNCDDKVRFLVHPFRYSATEHRSAYCTKIVFQSSEFVENMDILTCR